MSPLVLVPNELFQYINHIKLCGTSYLKCSYSRLMPLKTLYTFLQTEESKRFIIYYYYYWYYGGVRTVCQYQYE